MMNAETNSAQDLDSLLKEVRPQNPIIFTDSEQNKYAVIGLAEYNDYIELKKKEILEDIKRDMVHATESGYISNEDVKKKFGLK